MNYINLITIAYFDIMATCESGNCADFHLFNCWQNSFCFYDAQLQAAYQAIEMGY